MGKTIHEYDVLNVEGEGQEKRHGSRKERKSTSKRNSKLRMK
jgi:hypothetical protein